MLLSLVLGLRRPACSRLAEQRRTRAGAARLFVNLTNGVEALPLLEASGLPYTFCRLQSSLCEAQAFEQLVISADTHLLMSLACVHSCYVLDFASRNKKRGVPRAVWYGTVRCKPATPPRRALCSLRALQGVPLLRAGYVLDACQP